jgi:hypothetical protein
VEASDERAQAYLAGEAAGVERGVDLGVQQHGESLSAELHAVASLAERVTQFAARKALLVLLVAVPVQLGLGLFFALGAAAGLFGSERTTLFAILGTILVVSSAVTGGGIAIADTSAAREVKEAVVGLEHRFGLGDESREAKPTTSAAWQSDVDRQLEELRSRDRIRRSRGPDG